MTETIKLICFNCIHFNGPGGTGCKAFPDGIPDQILETNKHDKPLKEQENKIVFEPKKP
jgi:hypothetical protein